MKPEKLPCGCPTVDSLFALKGGGKALIVHPPVIDTIDKLRISQAIVWCTSGVCGWVYLTDEQFDEYSAVRG